MNVIKVNFGKKAAEKKRRQLRDRYSDKLRAMAETFLMVAVLIVFVLCAGAVILSMAVK